jgi:sugar phosphate isomerase/epimerase
MIAGREIALANLSIFDAPALALVDAAASAGFDCVTLRLTAEDGEANRLAADTPARRELLARLGERGIGVLDVDVVALGEDTSVMALADVLEGAAALGARHVLAINRDRDESRAAERFAELCVAAAPFGLRVVLEFLPFTATKTVEQADQLVATAGHPAGGVLVDPLHLKRSGGSPAAVAGLRAANPERYPYLQICDGPAEAPPGRGLALYTEAVENRIAPGEGELPLAALLAALPGAPLSVECPVAADAQCGAALRAEHLFEATRALLERGVTLES